MLLETSSAGAADVNFKIGAKASATQASGNYTNVIRFQVVAKPNPKTIADVDYMQDFAGLTSQEKIEVINSMLEDTQYSLKDSRDNKGYSIAKLKDGNVWMTQNLDYDIDSTKTYTSGDTDLPIGTTWQPLKSTGDAWNVTSHDNSGPESHDFGDVCWDDDPAVFTYSCSQQGNNRHLGNYYNFIAATATNSFDISTNEEINVNQSICPAGWALPGENSGTLLANHYGRNPVSGQLTGTYLVWDTPMHFSLGGRYRIFPNAAPIGGYNPSLSSVSAEGHYWTSVYKNHLFSTFSVFSDNRATDGSVSAIDPYELPVRCLVRQ